MKRILFTSAILVLLAGGMFTAHAQQQATTYNLLAPLPGGSASINDENGFETYASQVFAYLLSVAAFLAVIMVVIGGVQYLASGGNTSVVSDAKGRIWSAVGGLLLAVGAWLILYTINPDLIRLKITVPDTGLPGQTSPSPNPQNPACGLASGRPNGCACTTPNQCASSTCDGGKCAATGPIAQCAPGTCNGCGGFLNPCDASECRSKGACFFNPVDNTCITDPVICSSSSCTSATGRPTGCSCDNNSQCAPRICSTSAGNRCVVDLSGLPATPPGP